MSVAFVTKNQFDLNDSNDLIYSKQTPNWQRRQIDNRFFSINYSKALSCCCST